MSAGEGHVPRERNQEQQTSERKPVHGDNSLGPTDPGARVPAQEFQKHLKLKQGSESEFHTKARLDVFFFRIQGSIPEPIPQISKIVRKTLKMMTNTIGTVQTYTNIFWE